MCSLLPRQFLSSARDDHKRQSLLPPPHIRIPGMKRGRWRRIIKLDKTAGDRWCNGYSPTFDLTSSAAHKHQLSSVLQNPTCFQVSSFSLVYLAPAPPSLGTQERGSIELKLRLDWGNELRIPTGDCLKYVLLQDNVLLV